METKQLVLQNCRVEQNIVKLPDQQLDRKLYMEVSKALELIGGKWKGGKIAGFVFPTDPTELLEQIAGGEQRNLKKEYQFFATPPELADEMVLLANIGTMWTFPNFSILEPSAGQGAIIDAIHRLYGDRAWIYAVELMDINYEILMKKYRENKNVLIVIGDFLERSDKMTFNRIIANPPFTKNQDIDHIMHMYKLLAPGGKMVSLASESWDTGTQKKQVAFRDWLCEVNASVRDIPRETFKSSGTMVGAKMIIITKEH